MTRDASGRISERAPCPRRAPGRPSADVDGHRRGGSGEIRGCGVGNTPIQVQSRRIIFSTSQSRESAPDPESTSSQARIQRPFRGAGSAGIEHAVQGESTGGGEQRVQQDRLPGTPHAQLYTVVRGGFETWPGWRIELAVVSGAKCRGGGHGVSGGLRGRRGRPPGSCGRGGVPRCAPPAAVEVCRCAAPGRTVSAQWPFTGGLSLRWSLQKG